MLSTSKLDLSEPPATWSKDDENESFPSHRNRRDNGCRYLRGICPRAWERNPGRMGTHRSERTIVRSLITAWACPSRDAHRGSHGRLTGNTLLGPGSSSR